MFKVRILSALLLILPAHSATAIAAEKQVPLVQVPLNVYGLKDWSIKKYQLYFYRKTKEKIHGVQVTERLIYPVASTEIETRMDEGNIYFKEWWRDPEGKVSRTLVECSCRPDNLLSLRKMDVTYRSHKLTTNIEDGKYSFEFLKKHRAGDWPDDTLTESAFLRLVTLLPKDTGTVYTYGHWSPTPGLGVEKVDGKIRCFGEETVEVSGKAIAATRYETRNIKAWVRGDGVLARVEIPGWKVLELEAGQ